MVTTPLMVPVPSISAGHVDAGISEARAIIPSQVMVATLAFALLPCCCLLGFHTIVQDVIGKPRTNLGLIPVRF